MKSFTLILVSFVCLFLCTPGEAAKYTVDPVHSSVDFEIGHMGISEITGRFRGYSGVIEFDPENIAATTLSATLEISSIDTANEKRDEHLQQDDYFDTAKHPYITFVSKKVEQGDDDDEFIMTGDLTMHGMTQEIQMEFELGGMTKNHKGVEVIGFELEGEVDRLHFGIGDDKKHSNGELFLGAEVEFEIHAEAVKVE
ncbi:MAG: polyisoprenoid-binding protein [Candidatus Omnitrophica bacterium]|nr:polyisoprenoid-binding protein [Candidatus Omnitrophota bacterium]